MKRLFALTMLALMLSGCSTLDGKFDNRVVCTVARDKAFVVSEYGPIGIANTISKVDQAVICK
jgi:hypothetical protein